ncbi:hydroxymethylbilane synthase [Kineosporia sp. NBRC 101731]|uniref:hydroxymethylbilane synthase n=1 Tax=Kineosporia sp. NBRC 101731 TaxID=3032199 RepID=UPI0024A41880|nr:hydroxymethylbilane synthase [Kineosporia sp. NBRC 101731]GLY27587.1 porphobilinogen deaminase 1 [Kineosporia sp. NBRC 101731]
MTTLDNLYSSTSGGSGLVPTLDDLPSVLRLGTRRSQLARTQSQWFADRLVAALALVAPEREFRVELVEVVTSGDVSAASNTPLTSLGGTGVFVSALREAVLRDECDFAVHSLKDLPNAQPEGLTLASVPRRECPADVLIGRDDLGFDELPAGSVIGTGSPRRAAQMLALRDDIKIVGIRGNIDTRIGKVATGEVDAVVLALAGLRRIGRHAEATHVFTSEQMLPAPGQGALAVECRSETNGSVALLAALRLIDDAVTRLCVLAERALLARLEAGCAAPVGALATYQNSGGDQTLTLTAFAGSTDGTTSIRHTATARTRDPRTDEPVAITLGRALAEQMLDAGAALLIPVPDPVPAADEALAREGDS